MEAICWKKCFMFVDINLICEQPVLAGEGEALYNPPSEIL